MVIGHIFRGRFKSPNENFSFGYLTCFPVLFQCTVLSGVGEEAVIATKTNTAVEK